MPELSAGQSSLVFDPEKHQYRYGGVVVPSVTQVLSILQDFSQIDPGTLEWKANLGTQVHAATELDDSDNLGEYDQQIGGYIEAWRRFKRETGFRPVHIEQKVFHKKHMYAGTLDRIGVMGSKNVLVDIKTTSVINLATVGPQTAAYAEAWGFHGMRFVVQLKPDGKYKLEPCKNKMDFQVFLNCLNLWRWKEQHK